MKEAIVTPRSERPPGAVKQAPSPAGTPTATVQGPTEPAAGLLSRLERQIDSGLGSLREGVEPLLGELRQGLAVLYPAPGGQQLPPQQQQEQRTRLAQVLDSLEDILEALQRAARANRKPGLGAGPRGH
ncbi:MAG TPA: hypothetical protein VF815_21050 [Myxococcaceae bacterium]|jgi:hypothetical protein